MLRRYLCLVCLFLIIQAASGCKEVAIPQVHLNEEFSLAAGERAFLVDDNMELRFQRVTEDSRCPKNVTCVWAGRVSCEVEVSRRGSSSRVVLTEPGTSEGYSRQRYGEYELAFHVTPYPEAGKEISKDAYRLHLIITKFPESVTGVIGSVLASPFSYEGQEITVIGYYRGWDLLHEAEAGPPDTRSDWVIRDSTGAIYVSANSSAKVPQILRPDSPECVDVILRVEGIIHVTSAGQPYLKAKSIELVS